MWSRYMYVWTGDAGGGGPAQRPNPSRYEWRYNVRMVYRLLVAAVGG